VRGEIVRRANAIEAELRSGSGQHAYPFSKVVYCNIGNPQILGQRPITFFRQVLALCELPQVGWRRGCAGGGVDSGGLTSTT
jgi:alanine transaminase